MNNIKNIISYCMIVCFTFNIMYANDFNYFPTISPEKKQYTDSLQASDRAKVKKLLLSEKCIIPDYAAGGTFMGLIISFMYSMCFSMVTGTSMTKDDYVNTFAVGISLGTLAGGGMAALNNLMSSEAYKVKLEKLKLKNKEYTIKMIEAETALKKVSEAAKQS